MKETWIPWAIRHPGPLEKVGYGSLMPSEKVGLIPHSMEGPLSAALGELHRLDRRASWHLSISYSGHVYQHYPLEAVVWANGSYEANIRFVSVEHEGRAGELLTDAQVESLAKVIVFCGQRFGWQTYQRHVTLWEHREMTRFGSAPTACPSDRIPWDKVLARVKALAPGEAKVVESVELTDRPIGVTGQPIRAYILRAGPGVPWHWEEAEVQSFQQFLVGFMEGWLRPKWLHELLESLGTAQGIKLPVPDTPPDQWPALQQVTWDLIRHALDQDVHPRR